MNNTQIYLKSLKGLTVKDYFADWTTWEKSWLAISTIAILVASIMTWNPADAVSSYVATISGITGIWCVILVAKKRISNYIWGVINVAFYAWASYTWGLYGEVMLNALFFLPMQFIGWKMWVKPEHVSGTDVVKTKSLGLVNKMQLLALSIMGIAIYAYVLQEMGGSQPWLDSMSTTLSVVAMIAMAYRLADQWIAWIVVDVVTVIMWSRIVFMQGGLFNIGILIMWVAYLINAVYGYYNWKKGE